MQKRRMVIEVVDDAMADSLRRKTPAQRLSLALDMWRCARDRLQHMLRTQHPDWTEDQLRAEFRRRMLGSN
jgi:hypothetical protein